MFDSPGFVQEGWRCPVCGRVFSPSTAECPYCGRQETVTNTESKPPEYKLPETIEPGYMPDVHWWGNTQTGKK
jgi:rubredoxin